MGKEGPVPGPGGLVLVDKAAGMSSHDVVARIRRLANTRKVGHAGTLDPMATGVLVVGIERTTRLLGYLAGGDKSYTATIRLGQTTDTDDAEGTLLSTADAGAVTEEAVRAAMAPLTGEILQVPTTISAIKVDGTRAYKRARAGEDVELAARPVTVSRFELTDFRGGRPGETTPSVVDVDVEVDCSTGTYVRALARDLGAALGVGGHLTALRRTRVGPFGIEACRTLEELAEGLELVPLAAAARAAFPHRDLDAEAARIVANGGWIPVDGATTSTEAAPAAVAAFGPDGDLVCLLSDKTGRSWPIVGFTGPGYGVDPVTTGE
ncbi:MAG TPA: tRNA pseudouridine(55) synthase TruB [Sporichthya sp.]|nr:tRNA pseudouridine(55) synthase TruB [Sporichthya sp.]